MSKRLVVALSGGVGGAKLALGLSRVLPADELLVVANTGDDFEHLGLSISPDIDTLTYALAGIDNPATGWGRRDETWSFMDSISALGGEDWFRLGDRDLALHVERTRRLRLGQTLSEVTSDICRRLGIGARVVPMSDDRVRTRVRGEEGWIDFQDYFVRQQCRPVVHELAFDGVTLARPQADITAALHSGDVRAVIICPSNPFVSVEPILRDPRHARCDQGEWRTGRRGVADHRRAGRQGPDGEDDARTRPRGQRRRRRRTLWRPAGRLYRRPRRRRWDRQYQRTGHDCQDPDEEPAGPGDAGARNARRGGRIGVAAMSDIWAVIPVKEFDGAKYRLSGLLSPPQRRLLADTMLTDMLDAVAGSRLLAGVDDRYARSTMRRRLARRSVRGS